MQQKQLSFKDLCGDQFQMSETKIRYRSPHLFSQPLIKYVVRNFCCSVYIFIITRVLLIIRRWINYYKHVSLFPDPYDIILLYCHNAHVLLNKNSLN